MWLFVKRNSNFPQSPHRKRFVAVVSSREALRSCKNMPKRKEAKKVTENAAVGSTANKSARMESSIPCTPTRTGKRTNYLSWDEYFMSVAFLSAQRSKDPNSQVGACVVNQDRKIVGIGYNGMPNGCSDDELPWSRNSEDELDTKYPYGMLNIDLSTVIVPKDR